MNCCSAAWGALNDGLTDAGDQWSRVRLIMGQWQAERQQLDPLDWERFERDGFLELGRVCDPSLLAALQERIDHIMLGQVVYPDLYMQVCPSSAGSWAAASDVGHPPTLAYRKIMGLEADEMFREYMKLPLFHELAARTCGPEVAVVRAMFFNKPKERGKVIDWHQDREGPNNLPPLRDGDGNITVWTALDPCPRESGCLQVVRGAQKRRRF